MIYPGILHLYDAASDKSYTITTNQADSEVLLVVERALYYRVITAFYSAPITSEGVGAARLLASSEVIRDAHWALIKP